MIQFILIAFLSLLAQFILPWWSLALVAFVVCLWKSPGGSQAFLCSFAGVAAVWILYALIIHIRTDGIFTSRMSLLIFKTSTAALPVLVGTFLSGLVGGLAGLSGFMTRQALRAPSAG